ncbi:MAG: 4-alpha-glucanotransferase [Myxococcota bacterium]
MHPTSLTGPYGVGDIGPRARDLLGWLDAANQRVWQVLPLNPVDGSGCPYASASAFARDPLLLSPDDLLADGWIDNRDKPYAGNTHRVDWPTISAARRPMLHTAADRVRGSVALTGFVDERPWLAEWSLYRAITEVHGPRWTRWPESLRERDPTALAAVRDELAEAVEREVALQWLFEQQWQRLRAAATAHGIALWGDMPIFVGLESCDVWAHRELFHLDGVEAPVVTGVPPDAFSPEGQRWGHPMYDVAKHAASDHAWWRARSRASLELVDTVRIDHFRGVESSWEIGADQPTAMDGRWVQGLGAPLLEALLADADDREMPFVAEDLGIITSEVSALRDQFRLPGMAVLQFAFTPDPDKGDWGHPYLPHNHRQNQVVYTGTHDNDTTLGWFWSGSEAQRDRVRRYLSCGDDELPWKLVLAAWRSVCDTAIVPLPDLLGLGSDARLNTPGTVEGNWSWRMPRHALGLEQAAWMAEQSRVSGR